MHRDSATALRTAIDASGSLADTLLDACLTAVLRDERASDIHAVLRDAGIVIAALPPSRWLIHIDRVTEVLGVPPGTVHKAVLDTDSTSPAPRRTTIGPRQASRLTPPSEDRHRTGHVGRPSSGTPSDLHRSR
jgi:hypothetical protein